MYGKRSLLIISNPFKYFVFYSLLASDKNFNRQNIRPAVLRPIQVITINKSKFDFPSYLGHVWSLYDKHTNLVTNKISECVLNCGWQIRWKQRKVSGVISLIYRSKQSHWKLNQYCWYWLTTFYLSRAERPHFSSASADFSPNQKGNCPHQAIFLLIKYSLVRAG